MNYLITGLPRSRTAWFAEFMGCPHEPIVRMNNISDIDEFFEKNEGCSDFGMGFWLGYILEKIKPRVLVIERPIEDVKKSLKSLNLDIPDTNFCELLADNISQYRANELVKVVHFDDLNNTDVMESIFYHLRPDEKFDKERFLALRDTIIEADCNNLSITGHLMQKEITPLLKVNGQMNFEQILENINIDLIKNQILARDDLWNKNPARLSNGGPHRETHDIYIRGEDETPYINKEKSWVNHGNPHIPVWFESCDYLPEAKKIAIELSSLLKSEMIGLVLIYKVEPGKMIYPHIDKGWHPSYFEKFNVCIQSNEKAAFVYDDNRMVQKAGDVHWFRNDIVHSVINEGDCDHIIMTVCLRFDDGYRCPHSPNGWSLTVEK